MKSPDNFLGIPEKFSNYSSAKFAVLPVPYEATVSYMGGTAKGPHAIIEASKQVELYDEELERETCECGIATLPSLQVGSLSTDKMAMRVEETVAKILADKKIPVVLGGEHSITLPVVAAVKKAHSDMTVVQFDAHADLRQEYEGNKMSHACALARVRDICPAVQIGIRNLSKDEAVWAKKDNLPIFYAHKIFGDASWMEAALAAILTEKVYVTFDVDAFDSSVMPATGTPEPGGLFWYDVTRFLSLLARKKKIVGLDFVELAPLEGFHACDFLIAKLIYRSIGYSSTSSLP